MNINKRFLVALTLHGFIATILMVLMYFPLFPLWFACCFKSMNWGLYLIAVFLLFLIPSLYMRFVTSKLISQKISYKWAVFSAPLYLGASFIMAVPYLLLELPLLQEAISRRGIIGFLFSFIGGFEEYILHPFLIIFTFIFYVVLWLIITQINTK